MLRAVTQSAPVRQKVVPQPIQPWRRLQSEQPAICTAHEHAAGTVLPQLQRTVAFLALGVLSRLDR